MRFHALAIILAAATIGLLPLPAAQAQTPAPPSTATPSTFTKILKADLAKVFQEAGYRADVPTSGSPRILTGMSGYKVAIFLYSCDDTPEGKSTGPCGSMEFSSSFTKSAKMTLSIVNKWNQEKRYAKAYLDTDGDLNLEYDVSFAGGVTGKHVIEAAGVFETLLPALEQFINKPAGN
jgi:hypothetical protein